MLWLQSDPHVVHPPQGLLSLVNGQEARRSSGTEAARRQFTEVAGTVLLDVEMTVKLLSQGKVTHKSCPCISP